MRYVRALATSACAGVFAPDAAFAHAVCGDRVFPVTLTIDDPGVADEASVPTFTYQRSGANGGPGAVHEYGFNFEYDKRITDNFGLGVNDGYTVQQINNAKTQTGFQNLSVTAKYQDCISPEHEFIVSLGIVRGFGRTGTEHIGADRYGGTTPTLYFGKGLGDVSFDYLRPLAITGEFSKSFPDKSLKTTTTTDPDTGLLTTSDNRGNANLWSAGLSVQYSLPYLRSQVKDLGLPTLIGRLTPLVEFTWTSPATSPSSQGTTWAATPGVIYSAVSYQVGVELVVPLNKTAGTNVGVIAQLHLFLDDLLGDTVFGRPIFPSGGSRP